jgi:hypothetical protein
VNLIVYLNKNWKEEYGGALQLWDETMSTCQQVMPTFNTAILFRTSDVSYHGLPKPITCPVHMARQSCAIYYVSEPRPNVTQRYKASFVPLPGQPVEERLQKLYDIRKDRLIQPSDLWPSWRENGYGFW